MSSSMQGYLPALEGMTEEALATLYDTYCRLECAPPLPVVQCIARYLVGQLEYPTNLVKFLTPMTPNHMAVIRGDMPTSWDDACDVNLQWMLEEPNRRITHTRFTVAHFAALIGHIGIVRAIPDAAVRDHLTTHGSTVLYVAALGNPSPTRLACVQCILSRGLSPEQIGAASANGVTPLYVAGESGNLDVAKTLYEVMPSLLTRSTANKCTPMFGACFSGHLDVVRYYHSLDPSMIRKSNRYGTSTMAVAALRNHAHIVRFLHEADPTIIHAGASPSGLYYACQLGHLDTVRLIMEILPSHMDVEFSGKTPFHIACENGHIEVVKFLFEKHIQKKIVGMENMLEGARTNGHLEVVAFLTDVMEM